VANNLTTPLLLRHRQGRPWIMDLVQPIVPSYFYKISDQIILVARWILLTSFINTLLSVRSPVVIVRVSISIIYLPLFVIRCFDSVLYVLLPCIHFTHQSTKSRYIARIVIAPFLICTIVSSTFGRGCACQNHEW
jgi:hypothetical protein